MEHTNRLWENGPLFIQAEHVKLTGDTVLLADFALQNAGGFGVDLGCASGALMIIMLAQKASLRMAGIELVPGAIEIAGENIRINGLEDRAAIFCSDFRRKDIPLQPGSCDFVICNPPYFSETGGLRSPDTARASAREEMNCNLKDVCVTAARLCRSTGRFFLCYRPDRLVELLRTLADSKLEPKRLRFVHHHATAPCSLILVEARKDGKPGLEMLPPLVLREKDGEETEEYRRIYKRHKE